MIIKKQPSWSLFFTWGVFVFLPINFFTGILLSKFTMTDFIYINIISFILFALTLYPTVYISIKYNLTYAKAIDKFIKNTKIKILLLVFVIIINVGWYSIQLSAVYQLISYYVSFSPIFIFLFSYLFSYGSYKYEYNWLKYFGIFVSTIFFMYILYIYLTFNLNINIEANHKYDISFLKAVIVVYGTWAFSSSTLVMDVTVYTKKFYLSYIYILLSMLFFNTFLILLGFLFSKYTTISSFKEFLSLLNPFIGITILFLSIWSTNDSNFFSSMRVLNALSINKKLSFIILPLICGIIVIIFQDDLFNIIGKWLEIMGWIMIPLTIFWWNIIFKLR